MTVAMLSVTLVMRALPGQTEALADFWRESAERVLSTEPGCRAFHVSRNIQDPDEFTIFEIYESQEAFDAHHAPKPRSAEIVARLNQLRKAPIQRIVGRLLG